MNASGVRTADVLVIGAGFIGLSVACALLDKDPGCDVVVLDAADFAAGGSGRNGAGIRMQWSRDFNVQLSRESLEVFENAEALFDYPGGIDLRQQGYLILAHTPAALVTLATAVRIQNGLGVPSRVVSPDDCERLQPGLNTEGLHGGAFCAKDGTASPFKWLDALLKTCRRRGGSVQFGAKVLSLRPSGSGFEAVTAKGNISARQVVLCTDWAVSQLLTPLGIDVPVNPAMKEAMVTEACAPVVNTVLMDSQHGLGVKQMARGNVVLTLTRAHTTPDLAETPDYIAECALRAVDLLPALADVRLLRKWSGHISRTPDMQPVLGQTALEGLFLAVSAYKGFMISPAVGKIMADLVVEKYSAHPAAAALSPQRFQCGQLVPETLTL